MDIEQQVRRSLEAAGISWEAMPCDPQLADTAAFCEHYGVPPDQSANAIIVASKKDPKQYCACLVLADSRLDVNHTVSDLMGIRRLSFANSEETTALTGMMVGGVTIFGLPDSWPIYVDRRVMEKGWVIVGGGSRSMKIKLAPRELLKVPNLTVVDGLATAKPPNA